MNGFGGLKMIESGETLSIRELVELGKLVDRTLSKETSVKLYFSHPSAFQPLSKMMSKDDGCHSCGIKHIIGVLSNGHYALCSIGENVPELVYCIDSAECHEYPDLPVGYKVDPRLLCIDTSRIMVRLAMLNLRAGTRPSTRVNRENDGEPSRFYHIS
jgi:hypothetical protein